MKILSTLSVVLLTASMACHEKPKKNKPEPPSRPSGAGSQGQANGKRPALNTEESFNRFDKNRDGVVVKSEILDSPLGQKNPTHAEQLFSRRDKNQDQQLSKAEWTVKMDPPPRPSGEAPSSNERPL